MNYLYFDGGPLGGTHDARDTSAPDTLTAQGATYQKERSWDFARTHVINCYRYVGPSVAAGAARR